MTAREHAPVAGAYRAGKRDRGRLLDRLRTGALADRRIEAEDLAARQ